MHPPASLGLTLFCPVAFSPGDPGGGATKGEISELTEAVLLNINLAAVSREGPGEFAGFFDGKTCFLDFVTFDDGANSPYFISHVKYLTLYETFKQIII